MSVNYFTNRYNRFDRAVYCYESQKTYHLPGQYNLILFGVKIGYFETNDVALMLVSQHPVLAPADRFGLGLEGEVIDLEGGWHAVP